FERFCFQDAFGIRSEELLEIYARRRISHKAGTENTFLRNFLIRIVYCFLKDRASDRVANHSQSMSKLNPYTGMFAILRIFQRHYENWNLVLCFQYSQRACGFRADFVAEVLLHRCSE